MTATVEAMTATCSVPHAAKVLNVSRRTAYRYLQDGRLEGVNVETAEGHVTRVSLESLNQMREQRKASRLAAATDDTAVTHGDTGLSLAPLLEVVSRQAEEIAELREVRGRTEERALLTEKVASTLQEENQRLTAEVEQLRSRQTRLSAASFWERRRLLKEWAAQ